jgi:hypothetical protein
MFQISTKNKLPPFRGRDRPNFLTIHSRAISFEPLGELLDFLYQLTNLCLYDQVRFAPSLFLVIPVEGEAQEVENVFLSFGKVDGAGFVFIQAQLVFCKLRCARYGQQLVGVSPTSTLKGGNE